MLQLRQSTSTQANPVAVTVNETREAYENYWH